MLKWIKYYYCEDRAENQYFIQFDIFFAKIAVQKYKTKVAASKNLNVKYIDALLFREQVLWSKIVKIIIFQHFDEKIILWNSTQLMRVIWSEYLQKSMI